MGAFIARTVCSSRAFVHLVVGDFSADVPLGTSFVAATDTVICLYCVVDQPGCRPRLWRLCEQRVFGTVRAMRLVPCGDRQVRTACQRDQRRVRPVQGADEHARRTC